jgi:hypothetical protein
MRLTMNNVFSAEIFRFTGLRYESIYYIATRLVTAAQALTAKIIQ